MPEPSWGSSAATTTLFCGSTLFADTVQPVGGKPNGERQYRETMFLVIERIENS